MVTIDPHFETIADQRAENVDQRLAIAIRWRDYDDALRRDMLELLADSARQTLPSDLDANLRASAYHVGPMAQGLTVQMLFTAYEAVAPIATDVATWMAIGQFAHQAINRSRSLLRRYIEQRGSKVDNYSNAYLDDRIVVSQPLIQGLCVDHFMKNYSAPKQRVSIDATSRSPYPGIVWAGRPDASVIYTVRVWTGQTSYIYVIDGEGTPVEHFKVRGSDMTSLPLPEWYYGP